MWTRFMLCELNYFRCDFYKCLDNCTIQHEMVDGYYIFNLEMHDLDLHPGDHKLLLEDYEAERILAEDNDLEDQANQTFFDPILYHFLVKYLKIH